MITSRVSRWISVIVWAALIAYLMLSPGSDGAPADAISDSFGGMEITDWVGHVALFGTFAMLLVWLMRAYRPPRRALIVSAALALLYGILMEGLQPLAPNRGFTLYDLLGNGLGAVLVPLMIHRRNLSQRDSPT